jgi:hypothetical protein
MIYDQEYMTFLSKKISILFSYFGNIFKIVDDLIYLCKVIYFIPTLLILNTSIFIHSIKLAYYSIEILKTIIIPYFFIKHISSIKKYHDVSKININMEPGYYYYMYIFVLNWIFKILLEYIINYYDFKINGIFKNILS